MKKILLLILFSLAPYVVFPQSEEAVKAVIIEAFEQVVSTFDREKLPQYFTDDFLLLENGEIWNNDTLNRLFSRALQKEKIPKRINKLDFLEVRVTENMAGLAWDNHAEFFIDDQLVRKAHWLESAVLIKEKEKWKVRMLHSTVISNEEKNP